MILQMREKLRRNDIDGKLLRVIYEEEEAIVVVSAYRTSKVSRYLRD